MKELSFTLITLFLSCFFSSAQSCLENGIKFTNQQEINNFQSDYPGCTEIEGYVQINNTGINNLNGLSVLNSIGEYLEIDSNPLITTLSGLDNLTSIGEDLEIYYNSALTNLTGLNSLNSVGGNIDIKDNNELVSLMGQNSLTSLNGSLVIRYNDKLTSITGMGGLNTINSLIIRWNNELTNISGLSNLTTLTNSLYIELNDHLLSLSGLEGITNIDGDLEISFNYDLTDISGIKNINANSIENLFIEHNLSLSTCEVQSICDYIGDPNGTVKIHDNAAGCNSPSEVEAACELVDVENIDIENKFSIYPNPAKNKLSIVFNSGARADEIKIYNLSGQRMQVENKVNNSVNISNLCQGVYVIEVISNQWRIRDKLIVK